MGRAPHAQLQAFLSSRTRARPEVDGSEPVGATAADAREASTRSIGDIIRSLRSLSDEQVDRIVAHQAAHGMRFGEAAVALRMASGDEVLWALSQQFDYPYALRGRLDVRPELVVANDPFGDQAEAFRELRSRLMPEDDAPGRAFAVVSPERGDGRSYVAANLAIAFSQLGRRTLLIDADMRSPVQHKLFGRKGKSGLSSILAGHGSTDAIQTVPNLPSLFLLAVGTEPPNPLELLQRASFGVLIHKLLAKFDHLVVDVPAAATGADWRVIATACSDAVLVARPGKSRMDHLRHMNAAMSRIRVRVAGVVTNSH